ncbi:MAG: hypothetical protein ACU0DI_09985 [Paracoccaceae bacterium]
MTNDFLLVLGLFFAAFSIPSFIGAYSAGQPPRAAVLFTAVGAGLISWAVYQQPNTYSLVEIPELIISVFARIIR